jgi:uncharacterized membrane protein YhaH (DUF805 family)
MFDFSARINGTSYYLRLLSTLTGVIAGVMLVDLLPKSGFIPAAIRVIYFCALMVYLVFTICLFRQRANDINWHPVVLTLIACVTPLYWLLGCIPGDTQANRYGPVPPKGAY